MSEGKFKLDTIESAIRDIRDGKVVIVVDDKNRENEGDFLAAAELVTPENHRRQHPFQCLQCPVADPGWQRQTGAGAIDGPSAPTGP